MRPRTGSGQAIHDATIDLDAAPAVDMAYQYLTLVRMLVDDHHGEGYADAHLAIRLGITPALLVMFSVQYRATGPSF